MSVKKIFLLSFLFVYAGCTTVSEAGYYWGDYSESYYKLIKEPGEESIALHEENLRKIIKVSKERNLRVAPGIYAELGYIVSRGAENSEALALYEQEMKLYPESRIFLERLLSKSDGE